MSDPKVEKESPDSMFSEPENGVGENAVSKRGRIISAVVSAMLAAAVLLCLFVMAQVLSHGYVSVAGYSVFRVVTGSMEPEIPVGALLLSGETDISDIQENDIVCFRSKESNMLGQIITHRVVGIIQDDAGTIYLRTKGDANISEDAYYVTKENLVGTVMWYTGDGSALSSFFSLVTSKIGFLSIIVIPVLLVAALILRDNVKEIRKELDKAISELDEHPSDVKADLKKAETPITEDEYKEMYERLKEELLEEIKQGENEPSVGAEKAEGEDIGNSEKTE